MQEYGKVAIQATELSRLGGFQPRAAWDRAIQTVFPDSTSLQDKACPRDAYLGLCENGLVVGVPPGMYTRSR
jgi:hypothetical protein